MKITEKEFNAITGEETITERDETSTEAAERTANATAQAERAAADTKRNSDREKLLTKLGITSEEAALLLS